MREKLIQIYADARVPGQIEREIDKLRCSNCRFFKLERGFTECLQPENRWPDRDADSEEHLSPKADFFCALFEEKE